MNTNRLCIFLVALFFRSSTAFSSLPPHKSAVQQHQVATAAASAAPRVSAFASRSKPFAPLFDRQRSELSASPAAGDTAKSTSWTDARIHNTPWFRSLALLAAAAAAGSQTSLLSKQALAVLHLTSFGTWFGTVVYTTFVAGITMFKNLPRQTFGKLQAKLFPKYFALSSVCLILQLVSLTILSPALRLASQKALAISLIMTLLNQFLLEPISTSNMMERYQLEQDNQQTSDRYVTLKKSFGKYHGMSSLTNLIALCGGVAHAVYLATSLVK